VFIVDHSHCKREWRRQRASSIAAKEEESDRQRQANRRQVQSDLAAFLKDYAAKVEEKKGRPVDTAAFMTEFDGNPEKRLPASVNIRTVDWKGLQKLLKLLPPPQHQGQLATADRFAQIVNAMAERQ